MKSKVILSVGILAIVVGIATTGIAIKSVQAALPDPVAIKNAANQATAAALKHLSNQITSDLRLSEAAKNVISSKMQETFNQLSPP